MGIRLYKIFAYQVNAKISKKREVRRMNFPKQLRDIVYNLLKEPTLDNFREFLKGQTGEHNPIDFKGQWIDKVSLVKEMLSIANFGGGFIIFGVLENEDKTFDPVGLNEFKDKAQISNDIKSFISSELKYDVFDFEYSSSEYEKLQRKKFQMIQIEDTPEFIPFLSRREGGDGKNKVFSDRIYIRRGTSCESANEAEIRQLIQRRIEHIYPNSGQPLELKQHLEQLYTLYSKIEKSKTIYKAIGISEFLLEFKESLSTFAGETESIENPLYPDETYEEYISRLIIEKKKKIERVLDLR